MHSTSIRLSRGFSLLEMVVAMAILSISLGVLYQATGGATRSVRTDEKYAYAVELARSLLASNETVPRQGVHSTGETSSGGYSWSAESSPVALGSEKLPPGSLHNLAVSVRWQDGSSGRLVVLHSVVLGVLEE